MSERIEMPWKVRIVGGPWGSPTIFRNGRYANVTNRYFATKEEALAFAGNERHIIFAPGEAFYRSKT